MGQIVPFVNRTYCPIIYYNWVMYMKLRIRDLREDRDLTQGEIATYLSCDRSLYSKYEREERVLPLDSAIKLADYYKVTLDYLVGRD